MFGRATHLPGLTASSTLPAAMSSATPIAFFNGQYLPKSEVRISPDDRGFLFADGVYEVVRSYRGQLFAIEAHRDRLQRSLAAVRIEWPESERLPHIAAELIRRNCLADAEATVYVQVTRGVAPRHHPFPDPPTPPSVYACASPMEPASEREDDGLHVILVPDIRWARCDIKSVALLPNVLAAQQAREAGADEAIFVRDGVVTEGTRTNVAIVKGGTLVTHPTDHHILPGITRSVVLELCAELGIPVQEVPFTVEDLRSADELLIIGTTKEVAPAVMADGQRIGQGRPGPVARRLAAAYRDRVAHR